MSAEFQPNIIVCA